MKQKKVSLKKENKLTFYEAIIGYYTHKDKKFLEEASKLVSPYMLNQWLSNDINSLQLVAELDRYVGINKDIYLAFVYYLLPKRNKAPYLKYLKADESIKDEDEIERIRKYFEVGKKEFDKYYRRHI